MKRNGFYKIIFVNLQQLKECNIEELQETQRVAGCNVICLSETWHRPHNWPGGQQEERQHLAKLHNALNANTEGRNWFIHDIPCTCIGKINYDAIFGRHGMVIFCHPDLICEQRDVVMPTLNMQIDHRQAAVVLKTKDNKHECHLISCHLRTGDGTGDLDGGLKRLQLRATIDHLLKAPSDAILVAGGDFNIHPTKPFMGELIFQVNRIPGLSIESFNRLWVNARSRPWTHLHNGNPGNMLDHALIKTPKGIACDVELLGPDQITTDHPRLFLSNPKYVNLVVGGFQ